MHGLDSGTSQLYKQPSISSSLTGNYKWRGFHNIWWELMYKVMGHGTSKESSEHDFLYSLVGKSSSLLVASWAAVSRKWTTFVSTVASIWYSKAISSNIYRIHSILRWISTRINFQSFAFFESSSSSSVDGTLTDSSPLQGEGKGLKAVRIMCHAFIAVMVAILPVFYKSVNEELPATDSNKFLTRGFRSFTTVVTSRLWLQVVVLMFRDIERSFQIYGVF